MRKIFLGVLLVVMMFGAGSVKAVCFPAECGGSTGLDCDDGCPIGYTCTCDLTSLCCVDIPPVGATPTPIGGSGWMKKDGRGGALLRPYFL